MTGGGAQAAGMLLGVPGGSRTILEVLVPYQDQALAEFLGRQPEQFCSLATSRLMAERAWERACRLAPGASVGGLGCTASLISDRPKRGDHRFHVTVWCMGRVTSLSLTLSKGARVREGEEAVLDTVILNALAEAAGIEPRLEVPLLPGETIQTSSDAVAGVLDALVRSEVSAVCIDIDGRFRADAAAPPRLLVSGAFNPLHEGHCGLAEAAARLTGLTAAFELSVTNVDKLPLSREEIRRRVEQFTWRAPVWLTRAPTFAEKAALFPGAVFVVGADTAARIVAPRYYGDDPARLAAALTLIRDQGCRFLVAGRVDAAGKFAGLQELTISPACLDLFTGIPEQDFRLDLSSTQLREGARGEG
jgi:hypothetical protein